MKKHLMTKEYDAEELNDINEDIFESLDILNNDVKVDEYGMFSGKIRVTVQWLSEDDCDCEGFQHKLECPHHEICF